MPEGYVLPEGFALLCAVVFVVIFAGGLIVAGAAGLLSIPDTTRKAKGKY